MKLDVSTQVSLGVQGPDVARIHEALEELGRNVPSAEADTHIFGAGTMAVLKATQTDLGIPATGVVDPDTVRTINAALAARPTAPRTVRGQVRTADGRPAAGLSIFLYLQDPNGETVAGQSPLDESGAYQIAYQPPATLGRVDLRIEVRDATVAVEALPPGTSILPDADTVEVVDFVLSGDAHPPNSEYDLLLSPGPAAGGIARSRQVHRRRPGEPARASGRRHIGPGRGTGHRQPARRHDEGAGARAVRLAAQGAFRGSRVAAGNASGRAAKRARRRGRGGDRPQDGRWPEHRHVPFRAQAAS